jgi:hypothetical protein
LKLLVKRVKGLMQRIVKKSLIPTFALLVVIPIVLVLRSVKEVEEDKAGGIANIKKKTDFS